MSKTLISSFKILLSGILSLLFLTFASYFYYIIPNTYTNPDGSTFNAEVTDRRYVPHSFFLQLREGLGFGRTNNEGYMNLFDYTHGMKIDTLIMGSSQMQALEVPMKDSTASVLGKLKSVHSNDSVVYNLGMSANYFSICVQNLKSAIEKYKPFKYVVLETSSEVFSDAELRNILLRKIPNEYSSIKRNWLYMLARKNPYFILMSKQLQDWSHSTTKSSLSQTLNNTELLKKVLQYIESTVSETGAKAIIFYHPTVSLRQDGILEIISNKDCVKQFSDLCNQVGIYFLDMSERYKREYAENHVLPYGFHNTVLGKGHMNQYGHKMVAEEIYDLMRRIEAE